MKVQRTKQVKAVRWLSTIVLFGTLLTMMFPAGAWAVGTASGTTISNQATIAYQVGSVAQTPIDSDGDGNFANGPETTDFLVDRMVDLTVAEADGTYTDVSPGATAQVVTFTVANTGNATLDFDLSGAVNLANGTADPFGGTDNLDVTIVDVFVDSDGPGPTGGGYVSGAHTYSAAADTADFIDDLPQDQMINVYVVVNIPAAAVDGDIAGIILTALARNTDGSALVETAGADTAGVDTVFADGAGDTDAARDAQYADTDAFRVLAATLTVSKIATVVEDPINGAVNPKAIPGAYIEYTVTITNTAGAGATASNVVFSDDLTTEIGNGTLVFRTDSYAAGEGINVTAPDINGGAATSLTNAGGDDEGDYGATAANTVTVNCGNLDAGEIATVLFQVVVQ
jgi:uncharacterized repeat protein (TIGR01451 family)